MKVYLAADHRGFKLKEHLKAFLVGLGYDVADVGAHEYDPADDYPDFAYPAARFVAAEEARGILLCGSGAGVLIVANKVPGIRAAAGFSEKEVVASRVDDDSNVLTISADECSVEETETFSRLFLETPFSGEERHVRRLSKLIDIERAHMREL